MTALASASVERDPYACVGRVAGWMAASMMMVAAACGDAETTTVDTTVMDTAADSGNDTVGDAQGAEPDAVSDTKAGPGCSTRDDCEGNEACEEGRCVAACETNADCEEATPVCDTTVGLCIEAAPACPVAVITVAEGLNVELSAVLHVSASSSYAVNGEVTRWEWRVLPPSGSESSLMPSAVAEEVTFEPHIVGDYTFMLDVWDSNGVKSCLSASTTVTAGDTTSLRVELVWTTPGDPDESNQGVGAGSDLDLHFVLPGGDSVFFDDNHDVWAGNFSFATGPETPRIERSDEDGVGPEVLLFDAPVAGATYRIGVHYYDDFRFGLSYATLRVYIGNTVRDVWHDVPLVRGDMWDAFEIVWPNQVVRKLRDGGPVILPDQGAR